MKKSLLFFTVFMAALIATAQYAVPLERQYKSQTVKVLDDVGDFTITDSDGNTWNLYEQLALGKTIFIDLFSTT